MEEIELIEKRKPREKHFLQKDGTIIAKIFDTDVHFLKNGKYEEIDNTLINNGGLLVNKSNDFKVEFEETLNKYLVKMQKDSNYLNIRLSNCNNARLIKETSNSKLEQSVFYEDVIDDINIQYKTLPNKVKETIVLKSSMFSKINFIAETNLDLIMKDKCIIAKKNEDIIFELEAPYMEDSEGKINNNIYYYLTKHDNHYDIELNLDEDWLNSLDVKYPVYIDPTISNSSNTSKMEDTYIYDGDSNDTRYNRDYLIAGVQRINNNYRVNRSLIKFELPEIGTGSEIIQAFINLTGYPSSTATDENNKLISLHRITETWTESSANWKNMSEKYDKKIEALAESGRSSIKNNTITPSYTFGDITHLVKKWYRDTPNNGVLIKSVNEKYEDENYPAFFSKDNHLEGGNPKPIFELAYRNQTGLEEYLDYKSQDFGGGTSYINTYNGNMIMNIDLLETTGGNLPLDLNLIYNTNDVVLNKNSSFGTGFKLNYDQTIIETNIDNNEYLEYKDMDGTIHYFTKDEGEEIYKDEDGLNYIIQKSDNECILTDKESNVMVFTKNGNKYHLTQINDYNNNKITIEYNENIEICNIKDSYNSNIAISYNNNCIEITNSDKKISLKISAGKISEIIDTNGNIKLEYNQNNLVNKIVGNNKMTYTYDYYENVPYRMKKISQYGNKNNLGGFLQVDYGFNATTLKDNKGRCETIIFNENGSVESRNTLGSNEDIDSAYSLKEDYGNSGETTNRLLSNSIPTAYIRNYIKNSSFETNEDTFINSDNIEKSFSSEYAHSGNRSLKIVSNGYNQFIEKSLIVEKGSYYTFSGYFMNNKDIKISLSYINSEGNYIEECESVLKSNEFERDEVSIYYSNDAQSEIKIKIYFDSFSTTYIDDIQFEIGEIGNSYNIIDNSDFSEGTSGWNLTVNSDTLENITVDDIFEIIKFNNNRKDALKVKMNPLVNSSFSKEFPIKGKKGDLYTLSFWYKNEGVNECKKGTGNNVTILFETDNTNAEQQDIVSSPNFNRNDDKWQYYSYRTRALEDFKSLKLIFSQEKEANDFYVTNIALYKEVTSGDYEYDMSGNLVSITNQSKEKSEFKYDKNNQLISSTTPLGTKYKFEYDKNKASRLISAGASNGISNEIIYDKHGNPIITRISNKQVKNVSNGKYKIRAKGTRKYMKSAISLILLEENECSNSAWELERVEDNFRIKNSILPEFFISASPEGKRIELGKNSDDSLFTFEKTEHNSFHIYYVNKNSEKRYFKVSGNEIILDSFKDDEKEEYEFYIERETNLFIETTSQYTEDGKFIKNVTDSNGNITYYNIDNNKGLTNSIIDSNGVKTSFEYDDKERLIKTSIDNIDVNYSYDSNNQLSKISSNGREYNYTYDEFLNVKSVYINENKIITNNYEENNGNLISAQFANSQSLNFEYDLFDRIKKVYKGNKSYRFVYDNRSNLSKVFSDDYIQRFYYDAANRVYRYKFNDFDVKYTFDASNNLTNKSYRLGEIIHKVENVLDSNENIEKNVFDNDCINYNYDELERIISKNYNNKYYVNYKYKNIGKKTSTQLYGIVNNGKSLEYDYDNKENIMAVYTDGEKTREYEYNSLNELIDEKFINEDTEYRYSYDNLGNIQTISKYRISDNQLLNTNLYKYENPHFKDQLTQINGNLISYDEIGNMVQFGNKYSLEWNNGRELKKYINPSEDLIVEFIYDATGNRISKIVNGSRTDFYSELDKVIYEKNGDTLVYYLRDEEGNLIGLEYNSSKYYYIYNGQGEIVNIIDSNGNTLVTYEYDSWGNLTKLIDNSNFMLSKINSYIYKGYYYDKETGLYYLKSRYYNSQLRRYINMDVTTGEMGGNPIGHNMYQYALNNPVNLIDESGNWPKFLKKIGKKTIKKIAIGVAAIAVGVAVTAVVVATGGAGAAVVAKAAVTAVTAGLKVAAVTGAVTATVKAAKTYVDSKNKGKSNKEVTQEVVAGAISGFSDGFMIGGIYAGAAQTVAAGFKIATNFGAAGGKSSGINISKNVKVFSPDSAWRNESVGGTLLKTGSGFRIDVNTRRLLHFDELFGMHHVPGAFLTGIYGIIRQLKEKD